MKQEDKKAEKSPETEIFLLKDTIKHRRKYGYDHISPTAYDNLCLHAKKTHLHESTFLLFYRP